MVNLAMAETNCIVHNCAGIAKVRSLCPKHYSRWRRHGDTSVVKKGIRPPGKPKPPSKSGRAKARPYWEKVRKTESCWIWEGRLRFGYGVHAGKQAHRMAYEELAGPIPEGLEIDHLCRNPPCVNPAHMEPVTKLENLRRMRAAKTHCSNGHEYTPENTYSRKPGLRTCRTCNRAGVAAYAARKKLRAEGEAA